MKKQKKLIETPEENVDENVKIDKDLADEYNHVWDESVGDYSSMNNSSYYDTEEYRHERALNDRIYVIFHESRWCALSPNKKVPKDLIPCIFQDLLEAMDGEEFTMVEKFVGICDFMNVAYLKAYELIHMKYKETIVSEMDIKFGVVSKKRIRKIF